MKYTKKVCGLRFGGKIREPAKYTLLGAPLASARVFYSLVCLVEIETTGSLNSTSVIQK